jgi:seryl-tRNA synthetase
MENNNSQELFKKNIKRIIELENEEKQLKDSLNRIKEQKDKLNDNLISFMETNNITTKDIIYGDKKIKYIRTKNTEGITKKINI